MAAVETGAFGPPFNGRTTLLSPAAFGNFPTVIDRLSASPNSDRCTAQTIARMNQIIHSSVSSPIVRAAVRQATCHLPASAGPQSKAEAIFWWVKTHVEFELDESILRARLGIFTPEELLIAPARLLTMDRPSGDCDDFVMLTCTMLLIAGVGCEMVTVPNPVQHPWEFGHVFTQAVYADGTREALDTSHGPYPGVEVSENPTRRQVWPLFASSGLHGFALGDTVDLSQFFSDTMGIDSGTLSDVGSGFDWSAAFGKALPGILQTAETIGIQQTRPAGLFTQSTPYGTTTYNAPSGGAGFLPAGLSLPGPSSSWIWLLALGLGGFALVKALGAR